ncbi:MAG: hypothetical protein AAGE83_05420 [Pseudomonadota bacterium]
MSAAAERRPARSEEALGFARVVSIALPVVLSNALVPLQGAIDTAIIGNLGDATLLAAVTLGASAISLLFSSFNFLQMGVSGTTCTYSRVSCCFCSWVSSAGKATITSLHS